MDKIEVTQNARQAAFDAYLTCYEIVPNDLWLQALLDGKHDSDEMAQAFARFERDILATRTDATPVALAHISLEDDGPYIDLQVLNGETLQPADKPVPLYTHPPATDVAALVEALTREARAAEMAANIMRDARRTGGWAGADNTAKAFDRIARRIRQALAPFTKGQNDE